MTERVKFTILPLVDTYTQIIKTWGRKEMAADLGVPVERVRGWERFNKFPPQHWRVALNKAQARNIPISSDLLIDLAARD